jgi:succinate dehydrogenase / fumarate reductase, membrane anchor subunit
MRISGLLLIFLALYHLIWWNLVIGVEHLDSQIVIERWNNPLWRSSTSRWSPSPCCTG